jgi:hypothetical protein
MAAYAIQFRRGTTTEHSSFTGLLGEVTVDTTKKTIVVHDGSTAGGSPLALEGASISSSTGAFSSNVTVGGTLGVTGLTTMSGAAAVTGNLTMTGHVLPSANITYDLGSTSMMWRDVYIGPGSLYINGKKVIEDDSGTISITTDADEDLKFTTSGTGTLKLISSNGINITGELGAVSGDLQIGDHIDMNSSLIKELATPVSSTDAANKAYVDTTSASAVSGGANAGSFTTLASSGDATISGNLTVSGTTTTVNTTDVTFEDNMFVLNSNTTGTPTENSGFEVERGDSLNVQFLWNETDDRWSTGSNTFHAGSIVGPLTGNVTGNLTGNMDGTVGTNTPAVGHFTNVNASGTITGDVAGNVTGNVTGNTSGSAGTVTSIAAHLVDEDNMASDSATQVPSQQSVKAYVTSQIATKDNTDEMTEGSTNLYFTDARADARIATVLVDSDAMSGHSATTLASGESIKAYVDAQTTAEVAEDGNLYFTDARARGAISVSGDISYNSSTGVITTTGLASSDTGDLAEGSNLYYTNARADARTAISTAANTTAWEAYADQAEVDAESAAATDATTKADQALVDAKAYADTAESDAVASAESKDVVRATAATGYTDSREIAITSSYEAYADTAESDAIASAESKDVVRAAAAVSYTDAAIAALSDSAPATLNTLNELADALGDDANFSTTVTNSIATKLPLAGGAMTGAITTNSTFDGRDVATDGSKLDGIEASADVTDATNVTAAGAVMDSELTAIAHVKSLNQALTTSSSPSFTAVTATDFHGEATTAKYADLAERYSADAVYEEGTVVMFGGDMEVTASHGYGSMKIAGVVSMKPAFAMNEDAGSNDTHPYIALQGRVPCKVMGDVSKGDILVASDDSGVATKWMDADSDPRMTAYIGIAISDAVDGMVEVKVGK